MIKFINKIKKNREEKRLLKRKKKAFYYLRLGYSFLKWAERKFPNRHARKQFYNDVLKHGAIHSKYIQMFATHIDNFFIALKKEKKNWKLKETKKSE